MSMVIGMFTQTHAEIQKKFFSVVEWFLQIFCSGWAKIIIGGDVFAALVGLRTGVV
jgi:hypothetical protein